MFFFVWHQPADRVARRRPADWLLLLLRPNGLSYLLPGMVTTIIVFRGLLWLDKSLGESVTLGMLTGICTALAVFWALRRQPSSSAALLLQEALLGIGPFVIGGLLTGLLLAPFGETALSKIASLFGGAIFALGLDRESSSRGAATNRS